MASRFIDKEHGTDSLTAITDTESNRRKVRNLLDAAGIVYDRVDHAIKYNGNDAIITLADNSGTFVTSGSGNGAANGATVSAVETISNGVHKTTLTLAATPLAIADADAFAGVKIYDFPAGVISIEGAFASLAETTTSAIATTLNSGAVVGTALGSVTAAANPLVTTQKNLLDLFSVISSATINVAGAVAASGVLTAKPVLDGSTTAADVFLNVQITTNTEIDADATTTWAGTIVIYWRNLGDF